MVLLILSVSLFSSSDLVLFVKRCFGLFHLQIVYYILTVSFMIPLMIVIFAYINVGVALYKSVKEVGHLREGLARYSPHE